MSQDSKPLAPGPDAEAEAEPEPAWKAIEAARQERLRRIKENSEAAKAYNRRVQSERDARRGQRGGDVELQALEELDAVPYLTDDGLVTPSEQEKRRAKAVVYAVLDESEAVQFVGASRNLRSSLLSHLVRVPQACYWYKVFYLKATPSRALLGEYVQQWAEQSGTTAAGRGNDGAAGQTLWERPLNVLDIMTDEEAQTISAAEAGPKRGRAIKAVCRKYEAEIKRVLEQRQVTESLRFDPKMKERGLLDLKAAAPNTSVPDQGPPKAK